MRLDTPKKVLIFSDAHIGHKGSQFTRFSRILHHQIQDADIIVCNGDLFDFSMRTNGANGTSSMGTRQTKLIELYAKYVEQHPQKKFWVLLGNHDHQQDYHQKLEDLKLPNLIIAPESLLLGDTLITHGDTMERDQNWTTRCQAKVNWRMGDDYLPLIANWLHQRVHRNGVPFFYTDEAGSSHTLTPEVHNNINRFVVGHFHLSEVEKKVGTISLSDTGSYLQKDGVKTAQDIQCIIADYDGESCSNFHLAMKNPHATKWLAQRSSPRML